MRVLHEHGDFENAFNGFFRGKRVANGAINKSFETQLHMWCNGDSSEVDLLAIQL